MKPKPYDIKDPAERSRLLWELSGYLADDKEASRKAFLEDGTDQPGREYAIAALDQIRRAPPMVDVRPAVQKFAEQMEKVLKDNDHKDGWEDMSPWDIVERIREESDELFLAINAESGYPWSDNKEWCKALIGEATDMANFCMMLYDNVSD